MILKRVFPVGLEKLDELLSLRRREARAHADVLQAPCVVEEAEQQRSDRRALRVLVPAKSGDDAIALALMLHLQHRALVRLIETRHLLRHHAVEPSAFESLEPVR